MKISVVIPTYSRQRLLRNCLDALVQQSFADFEVIVVSDGTDPHTKRMIGQRDDSRISHLELPRRKGPAAARNHGLAYAAGKLIAFTDDDTLPDNRWLEHLWKEYEPYEKAHLPAAFTGKTVVPLSSDPTDYERNIAGLETAEFITANCAVSADAFELAGGFDETFTMAWREDSDLHFRLIDNKIPVIRCESAVVIHPVRSASWNVSIRSEKKNMFNVLLFKRHPALYKSRIGIRPRWNYYAILLFALLTMAGIIFQSTVLVTIAAICWILLVAEFALRRLRNTRKTFGHIVQMTATSFLIPFYSVYWKLYGSVKFKKLLL